MNTYELIIDSNVMKYLEKLPKQIALRIFEKLQHAKINPFRYFVKLSNREEYKLRVGDYRVIADIHSNNLVILVVYINHRSKVYKKL